MVKLATSDATEVRDEQIKPQVIRGFDLLVETINELTDIESALRENLAPVLSPMPPRGDEAPEEAPWGVPLADELRSLNQRLMNLVELLKETNSRIEV
jgi:hypothetical protein